MGIFKHFDKESLNDEEARNEKVTQALNNLFTEDELDSICFSLNIEWSQLEGNIQEERTKSLVKKCKNLNIIQNLIDAIVDRRSNSGIISSGKDYALMDSDMLDVAKWLTSNFSVSDTQELCSYFGLNWANIRGETQRVKIIELIKDFYRRDSIEQLRGYILEKRPFLRSKSGRTTEQTKGYTKPVERDLVAYGNRHLGVNKILSAINSLRPDIDLSDFGVVHNGGSSEPAFQNKGEKIKLIEGLPTELRHNDTIKLITILIDRVNLAELKMISQFAGINYEDVEGVDLSGKARDLVAYGNRHLGVNKILSAINSLRPDIDLSDFGVVHNGGSSEPAFQNKGEKIKLIEGLPTELRHNDTIKLITILIDRVNLAELKMISQFAGINYEDVEGVDLSGKARELVAYGNRHLGVNKILSAINSLRPDIDLSDFGVVHNGGSSEPAFQNKGEKIKLIEGLPTELRHNDTIKLITILIDRVNLAELKMISQFAGINYEDVEGVDLSGKARELVAYGNRHLGVNKILSAINSLRPDIDLSDFGVVHNGGSSEPAFQDKGEESIYRTLTKKINTDSQARALFQILGIRYDDVTGSNLPMKFLELVRLFERRSDKSIDEIRNAILKLESDNNDNLSLDEVFSENDYIAYLESKLNTDADLIKLCETLNHNYYHLSGVNLKDRIRSLVLHFKSRGQLADNHPLNIKRVLSVYFN
ncbi:MAG: hypothetical protein H6772_00095 [Pseudomonadales bacterium]|nr:hypothetical protein [Pseudomonadales bacterium]